MSATAARTTPALNRDLVAVAFVYIVILAADARWRARYQAAQAKLAS